MFEFDAPWLPSAGAWQAWWAFITVIVAGYLASKANGIQHALKRAQDVRSGSAAAAYASGAVSTLEGVQTMVHKLRCTIRRAIAHEDEGERIRHVAYLLDALSLHPGFRMGAHVSNAFGIAELPIEVAARIGQCIARIEDRDVQITFFRGLRAIGPGWEKAQALRMLDFDDKKRK